MWIQNQALQKGKKDSIILILMCKCLCVGDSAEAQQHFASTLSQTLSDLAQNAEGIEVICTV